MLYDSQWFKDTVRDKFVRYAKIETTSDPHIEKIPSTETQWVLLNLLVDELNALGLDDVKLNDDGYIIARLPASPGVTGPTVGFMAHVDTSSEMSGKDVKPTFEEDYQGGVIELGSGYSLDPAEFPELSNRIGDTIIHTDGTTLLGCDDKGGLAEIMTAVEYLQAHPEIKHGELEIIFTPDEETGKGMDKFPVKELRSKFAYTLDGDHEGMLETECFNAYHVAVEFTGKVIHLGSARGKLVNAVTMAANYVNLLPQNESPEATDERYGYFCGLEIKGDVTHARLDVFLRDFDVPEMERRIAALKSFAAAIEAKFPGGKVEVTPKKQYLNMVEHMKKVPEGLTHLEAAVRGVGLDPRYKVIRGGTDGARLSEMGIPTPNIFTGGSNYHSRFEWASLDVMAKASQVVVNLSRLWAGEELS